MADVLKDIEEKVKKNKVMLYMKGTPDFPQCGFSAHTVDILKSYGIPFASEDVLANPAVREGIKTALTPRQRQVLVASVLEGVPIDVLAERLGSNRNALYKTLHDARQKLRAHVAAAGYLEETS